MRALLLLLGVSGGVWIDVPYVRQDKNGCGSAVIWMIMQYWRAEGVPSVTEMQRELYSADAEGIYAADMERYFRNRQFHTFVFKAEWTDLEQHLDRRRPLIVCLGRSARGAPLHYVVVAGIDSDRQLVWLNDPAARKLLAMSRADFEKVWMDNWTLLALPEQPAPETTSIPAPAPTPDGNYAAEMDSATSAFRSQRYADAKRHVGAVLRSNPSDVLANDFMATLYFLDDNLDASLKYWNRAGKPVVQDVRADPELRLNPVLLERAVAFSRASTLQAGEYRETIARLDATGIFSRYELALEPVGNGRFDAILRASEKGGPGLSWLRGLPYQTLHPEFFNIRGRAINLRSMLRWNKERRRAWIAMSAPLSGSPEWAYSLEFDARAESWGHEAGSLSFRKRELKTEVQSIVNDRWAWSSGFALTERGAWGLKYLASARHTLVRIPEKRLDVDSSASMEAGRPLEADAAPFAKIESSIEARWLPEAKDNNYELKAGAHAGRAFGPLPFDELFVVGMDRDYRVWLRAHRPSRERAYAVSNWDFQKRIYQGAFLSVYAGPFMDNGWAAGELNTSWDAGLQLRFTLTGGLHFDVSYGKDLRSGRNLFFANGSH